MYENIIYYIYKKCIYYQPLPKTYTPLNFNYTNISY